MNIIDITRNNSFIKEMYPDGLKDFFIGNVSLGIENSITINLHSKTKPLIKIDKWGKWGDDYNIVVIELSAFLTKKCDIINWQCIDKVPYSIIITRVKDKNHLIEITNNELKIIIETDTFLFQKCETYIL